MVVAARNLRLAAYFCRLDLQDHCRRVVAVCGPVVAQFPRVLIVAALPHCVAAYATLPRLRVASCTGLLRLRITAYAGLSRLCIAACAGFPWLCVVVGFSCNPSF